MSRMVLNPWVEKTLEKVIHTLQDDVVKKKIQILILDPFLSYIIERLFPYVLFLVVMFGLMIVLCISTIGYLFFSVPPSKLIAVSTGV